MTRLDSIIQTWQMAGFSADIIALACQTPFISELANIVETPAPAPVSV